MPIVQSCEAYNLGPNSIAPGSVQIGPVPQYAPNMLLSLAALSAELHAAAACFAQVACPQAADLERFALQGWHNSGCGMECL